MGEDIPGGIVIENEQGRDAALVMIGVAFSRLEVDAELAEELVEELLGVEWRYNFDLNKKEEA